VKTFQESLAIVDVKNAEFFAADLFKQCFRANFPVPEGYKGLPIATEARDWHQYVAFYKWSEDSIEPVGFCNWIRYRGVYLEGGMCVRPTFYRRMPKEHWLACKEQGGIAQLMMEAAAKELNDLDAWFGYCGDKKAYLVDMRAGYVPTRRKYVIVKWFREVTEARKQELEDMVAAIGPF
jgi:hypothetical protein